LATAAIIRGTPFSAAPSGTASALGATIIISVVFVTLYLGVVILLHRGCAPLSQLRRLLLELAPASRSSGLQAAIKES
jgi:hypothetical protein